MKGAFLVVGATSGVGWELARLLSEMDYFVIATVRSDIQLNEIKGITTSLGKVITLDLAKTDTIIPLLQNELSGLKIPLAGVGICAALATPGVVEISPLSELREILEVNIVSNVAVFQACMPFLRASKGRLIFTSSNAGRCAIPVLGYYTASKFALEGVVDVMRRETACMDIKISIVEPGGINTKMQDTTWEILHSKLSALSQENEQRYGYLFRAFRRLLKNTEAYLHPAEVAKVMIEALESEYPKTRYQVGQDAVDLIDMALSFSDEKLDDFFRELYKDDGSSGNIKFEKVAH